MSPNPNDADVLRRYLLNTLDQESVDAVERRLFSEDRVFFRRLCLAEDELIDDYVRGELDGEAAGAFEQHFLCTGERRDKLTFARALDEYVEGRQAPRQGFWQRLRVPVAVPSWAMAAAAVLLVALSGVVWQVAGIQTRPAEIAVQLSPGVVRDVSGQLARVSIPEGAVLVRLNLDVGIAEDEIYRASLYRVTEDEIWSQGNLESTTTDGNRVVTLTLPAELLPPDDYYARLTGVPPGGEPTFVDRYDFRVIRP